MAIRQGSLNMHDVVQAAGDDCLNTFTLRVRHLFELFRLHAEQVRPLSACSLEALARAGLWWFIKGRMGLEMVIRAQGSQPNPQMHQQQMEMDRQEAYANLAKGYWLVEEAIPEVLENEAVGYRYVLVNRDRTQVRLLADRSASVEVGADVVQLWDALDRRFRLEASVPPQPTLATVAPR